METLLGWGTLGRASHDAAQTNDHVDAALAVALLFGVVLLPPLVGIRTMYTNCWFAFTVIAHLLASEAALGIATSMGITIMVGWYSLRVFDRYAFTAILNGWLGVWASSPLLGVAARAGDMMLHLLVPMLLVSCYLPLVRVWMSVPALISSRLWSHFVVGGGVFPKADHIYRFSPPRSQHFWHAAYKMELMLNLLVPLFCVLAHQRSFWVYAATAIAGAILFCLQLIRSLLLPKLRRNAKTIMCRLLSSGGIRPNLDFIVRDDSFWLDWMSEGLVAIGESYVGCLWATNSARTLDEVVASLLTIPMEGRQEMYRSWSARFVALAARLFSYPPSSMGLVVGAVSEQFDLCPEFRQAYMDRYFHQGFGIWTAETTTIDVAQTNKLANLDQQLGIRPGHTVLDISIGSWGGVGCYLTQQHPDATVVCVLSSVQEFARAKKFARELEVLDQMEFVLAETPEKLLTILSGFRASKFDRITLCGVVETVPDVQRTRFLRTLKRIQTTNGTTLLEFSACTAAHMATHAWTNKYVHSAYPCHAITLPLMRRLAGETGFTLRDSLGYSGHYERTFLEWNRRFQAQWGHDSAPNGVDQAIPTDQTTQLQHTSSLPESFKRTWEFYLLHCAACYRSGALQVFQIRMG
ncbi:Mycolic acid cyclopropane synthetase [Phytophthora pseudosyringae]|uniref:Mycolic acid cyclopropane synthetase n=1 Tax=Phytophthora pseudosyringae TaxID=221518 RepID=A0A8T1V2Z0_9STRA|nr:Mycolic acid cyclopropane synthetase [Phytophthora pseudosyringae]